MIKDQKKAVLFALLSVLCWSTVAPAFKLALNQISVIQLLTISTGIATITLFLISLVSGKLKLIKYLKRKDLAYSLLFAAINPVIYYLVLFSAYDRLSAQIAQPLNYTWPLMLSILSVPFLKQKLNLKSLFALLISFAGVIVISVQKEASGLEINFVGVFLALISSVAWAFYWLFQIKSTIDKTLRLLLNFSISFLIMLIVFLISGENFVIEPKAILPSVWTGIFEMGVTFVFWVNALKFAEKPAMINNIAYLSPFISLFFINLVLEESITLMTISGLILIITGILVQRKSLKSAS